MKRNIFAVFFCLVLSAFAASAESQWERDPQPLLWNFVNMYNPCVVETGGEYRFKMWFFGWSAHHANQGASWPGCDAIFHARSKDLRHWEVYSQDDTWDSTMNTAKWVPVLHAGERWYEAWHVGDPSVVLHNGKFYMAHSATSKPFKKEIPGYPARMVQCVMGAVSDDGIHWQRSAEPLLICSDDSATPKSDQNRIGDFHRPALRWDNGKWRLWFDYWLPGKGVCMGGAENTGDFMAAGGFKIVHDLKQPLMESWPNPEVIKVGNRYHSFSDPHGYPTPPNSSPWMNRQLREAVSDDGLHWEKLAYIPPDADADACHVPQAFVTTLEGQSWLYLFYSTQVGNKKHDGQYHYEYDRIRAMRRKL